MKHRASATAGPMKASRQCCLRRSTPAKARGSWRTRKTASVWRKKFCSASRPNTAGPITNRASIRSRVSAGTKKQALRLISKMTILSRLPIAAILILPIQAQVTTSQYDNARTGANVNETTLTPQNVNAARFGKLFALQADGDIYAQPLYLPGVEIPGKGKHNVVFIATEHDSVFAFDADGQPSTPLWQVSFLAGDSVRPVPGSAVQCPFIRPEIGITPTPAG